MILHIRQKLLALALCLFLVIALQSCGRKGGDPLEYRQIPFAAEISGRIDRSAGARVNFSAEIEFFEKAAEGSREFRIVFHSPRALSGLSVFRHSDGSVTLSQGNVEQRLPTSDAVSGFIKIAEMLDPAEDILEVSSISGDAVGIDGVPYLTVVRTPSCRVYIDPRSEFPIKAEFSDGEMSIYIDAISRRT